MSSGVSHLASSLRSLSSLLTAGGLAKKVGLQGLTVVTPSFGKGSSMLRSFIGEMNRTSTDKKLVGIYINVDYRESAAKKITAIATDVLKEKRLTIEAPSKYQSSAQKIIEALEQADCKAFFVIDNVHSLYLKDRDVEQLHDVLGFAGDITNSREGVAAIVLAGSEDLPSLLSMKDLDRLSKIYPLAGRGIPMNLTKMVPQYYDAEGNFVLGIRN